MDIDLSPYALIVVNTSSGKDSVNCLLETTEEAKRQHVLHRVVAVYSDLGADWTQSYDVGQAQCRCLGIPLHRVFPKHSLPDYLDIRLRFPSMKCRYCTAMKTGAIEKFIRQLYPAKTEAKILSITGERAEESPKRAKLPIFEPHKVLTAGNRQVFHYRPILNWSEEKYGTTSTQAESLIIRHTISATGDCHARYAFLPVIGICATEPPIAPILPSAIWP